MQVLHKLNKQVIEVMVYRTVQVKWLQTHTLGAVTKNKVVKVAHLVVNVVHS